MAEQKTGDPKDETEHIGGGRFVPVHGLYGVAAVMPGPVTAGPPRPEPEDEHWTLAPGHRAEPQAEAADDEEAPTELVRGTVRPAGAADAEPDPA